MIESRCGLKCSECEYRESMNCPSYIAMYKSFWGDLCDVKSCCEGRKLNHCGQYSIIPCDTLNKVSYDNKLNDNGKRIKNCRVWAKEFDPHSFIFAVAKQDAAALRRFFANDAIICWHDSNEQFSVEEYIRANCEYPNKWSGEIQRVGQTNEGIVILSKIYSDNFTTFATAFITLEEGKIVRLDEYYADYSDKIPDWRRDMKIGKPINP